MKVRLPQNRKNVLQQPLCSEEDEEVTFMLDESAVGLSVEQDFSYTWRDLILYNLSVGAKQEDLVMTTLHSGQEAALCTARLYMETAMIPILFTCLWALVIPPVPLV